MCTPYKLFLIHSLKHRSSWKTNGHSNLIFGTDMNYKLIYWLWREICHFSQQVRRIRRLCLLPATCRFLSWLIFDPEDGVKHFLQNVSWRLTDYTWLYPKRHEPSLSPIRLPKILNWNNVCSLMGLTRTLFMSEGFACFVWNWSYKDFKISILYLPQFLR